MAQTAYTEKQVQDKFNSVIELVEDGMAVRDAVKKTGISSRTFFEWIDKDLTKQKQYAYARACEARADAMAEDTLNIADDGMNDTYVDKDGNEVVNQDVIQRSKLRVDTRKFLIAKLHPKKYGDTSKITLEGGENPIKISFED